MLRRVDESGLALPRELLDALERYLTAELTTFARDGVPVTVGVARAWLPRSQRFMVTTSIGLPQKAYNIGRNAKVALLFSNPAGTGLPHPPRVLVQGTATVSPLTVWDDELAEAWSLVWSAQPRGKAVGSDPVTRRLMDWYYMRLKIHVSPQRIRWWPGGDMMCPAEEVPVG